jgi:hypothetical protein
MSRIQFQADIVRKVPDAKEAARVPRVAHPASKLPPFPERVRVPCAPSRRRDRSVMPKPVHNAPAARAP